MNRSRLFELKNKIEDAIDRIDLANGDSDPAISRETHLIAGCCDGIGDIIADIENETKERNER